MKLPRPMHMLLAGAVILALTAVVLAVVPVPLSCAWGHGDMPTCVRIEPLATFVGAALGSGFDAILDQGLL